MPALRAPSMPLAETAPPAQAARASGADSVADSLTDPVSAEPLHRLKSGTAATVVEVVDEANPDPIAERLRELGFVAGEPVKIVASGPIGAEPLLVQVGFTRFALRRAEAARVRVRRVA